MSQETKKKKKAPRTLSKIYNSSFFQEKLEEYHKLYDGNYTTIAERLGEEFNLNMDRRTVAEMHQKAIAKLSVDKSNQRFFETSFINMQKRWNDAWDMIGDLVEDYKKLRKLIRERSEEGNMQGLMASVKMTSQIIQITQEIRKQLEFIQKQNEDIKVYQQNNLVITPIQINQEIKKYFPKLTKQMDDKELETFLKNSEDSRLKKLAKYLKQLN